MNKRSETLVPYFFLLPAIALLVVFNLIPALSTFRQSFYADSVIRGAPPEFVGVDNAVRVFRDPVFWKSVRVTLLFSLIVNPLQTALALGLALIANQRTSGIRYFRSIYLLPVAVSINVTVVVWGLMVDPNAGLLNGILNKFGLPEQPFLTSPNQALWTIIMIISYLCGATAPVMSSWWEMVAPSCTTMAAAGPPGKLVRQALVVQGVGSTSTVVRLR